MSDSANRVFDAATRGGMGITPTALAVAIRAAAMECRDETGQVSLAKLYELTCEINSIKP